MMMFSEQFLEQNSNEINYQGRIINRFFSFNKKGNYIFKFTFISSASKHTQAIIFHLITFNGKIFYNKNELKKPKNSFPQLIFSEKYFPKTFEIEIILNDGDLCICNGSDLLGNEQFWRSLYGGCAMIIEKKEENNYIFYCNDHENDDDFDDLIFKLEIKRQGTREQGDI